MTYLNFDEYSAIGGTLDKTAFDKNSVRASSVLDFHTGGRVEEMAKVPEAVKYCFRDLVEAFAEIETMPKNVASKSQSVGGVSESISFAVKSKDDREDDIIEIITDYLLSETDDNGTPLLYRGCNA